MVMAPARTGNERSSKKAVRRTDQQKRGISSRLRPMERMLTIVVIKLIEPKIDEIPAICREKIPKSTDRPGWPRVDSGG